MAPTASMMTMPEATTARSQERNAALVDACLESIALLLRQLTSLDGCVDPVLLGRLQCVRQLSGCDTELTRRVVDDCATFFLRRPELRCSNRSPRAGDRYEYDGSDCDFPYACHDFIEPAVPKKAMNVA
jgi:hypothetical protein